MRRRPHHAAPRSGSRATFSLPVGSARACGIVFCLVLRFSLPAENWLRLILWLLLGFAVYFGYGRYHSVLARMRDREIQAGSLSG